MAVRDEPITTRFSVDISELKAGIQEANRQIKLANSEFKAISSAMDNWGSSIDGVEAKIKQLTTVEEAESKKLDVLKQQYTLVAQEQGENSKAAQDLMVKINNQQAAVNRVHQSVEKYTSQLNELRASSTQTRTASQKLSDEISEQEDQLNQLKTKYQDVVLSQGENSREARELAKEMKALNSDLSDTKQRLNDAANAADDLAPALRDAGDGASNTSGGFTIMKGALADLVSSGIQTAIGAIGDFIGSLFELSEATEEYRSMQAKVEGSANSFGYSIDFANQKYQEFYKYLGDDQMATNAITNLMGMQVSTETLSDIVNGAIGVWASYGDSIPIESLTESINESAQVGKVTGVMADTINWAKRSNEEWSEALSSNSAAQAAFNEAIANGEAQEDAYSAALAACADTQERADLIAQTLNQTYGTSKTTYDELTGSMQANKEAQLELKDTQAELGEAIEPVNTAITELKNKALEAVLPVVKDVAGAFSDFTTWLGENSDGAKVAKAAIIGVATALGIMAAAMAIQGLIKGVTTAFALLNTVMSLNPIMLVVTAIAALVAAFMYLWNTSEEFRQFWITMWEGIKTVFSNVWNAIFEFFTVTIPEKWNAFLTACGEFVNGIVTWFINLKNQISAWLNKIITDIVLWGQNMWFQATTAVSNMINGIILWFSQLPGRIWTWLTETVNKVVTWGGNLARKGLQAGRDLVDNVVDTVAALPGKLWQAGVDLVNGFWEGIQSMAGWLYDQVTGFFGGIVDSVLGIFGIHSPSRVFKWIAEMLGEGFNKGFEGEEKSMLKQVGSTMKNVVSKAQDSLSGLKVPELNIGSRNMLNAMQTSPAMVGASNQTFVFNQNIESPKAVDRWEVYRDTKNLLNMIKKVR